jgi:5'-nucleotidase
MSGSGSLEFPPIPLIIPGEFNTIPVGAPAYGPDPNDPSVYYVNSFPATSMEYGIEKFAPIVFGGAPDFAVTGPNVGSAFFCYISEAILF